jgi:hypothetical protein
MLWLRINALSEGRETPMIDPMDIRWMAEENGYKIRVLARKEGSAGRTFVIQKGDDWATFGLNPKGFEHAVQWLQERMGNSE